MRSLVLGSSARRGRAVPWGKVCSAGRPGASMTCGAMFSLVRVRRSPLGQGCRGAPTAGGKTRASRAMGGVEARGGGAAEEHATDDVEDQRRDGVVAQVEVGGWVARHDVGDAGAVEVGRAVGVEGGVLSASTGLQLQLARPLGAAVAMHERRLRAYLRPESPTGRRLGPHTAGPRSPLYRNLAPYSLPHVVLAAPQSAAARSPAESVVLQFAPMLSRHHLPIGVARGRTPLGQCHPGAGGHGRPLCQCDASPTKVMTPEPMVPASQSRNSVPCAR